MNEPVCGKCGKVMTPADSRIHPEWFLHDACLPEKNVKERLLQLVDDYGNACLKAGQSNSGFCIDPSGSYQWERMQELRKKLREGIESIESRG